MTATAALRVALDVGPLVGRRTGIGVAVAELAARLAERDDVTVVPYLVSRRAPASTEVRRCPLPAAVAMRAWASVDRPTADRWLGPVDVIHGTNYTVPPVRRRTPSLVSVYDCWFLDHPELADPAVARAGRVLLRAIQRGAVVHASSEATARRVRHHAPGAEVIVVPLGALPLPDDPRDVPAAVAETSIASTTRSTPFVLAVGTQERRKGFPRLVDGFARLITDPPDGARGTTDHAAPVSELRLVIAGGEGDDSKALADALDGLPGHVRSRIHVLGWVDEATRSWLLRRAAVLAYPSLDEGFGFPLLDAMQARTPIVATEVGSIPEVAGDAAILVADHGDVAGALAAAIARVLTDDDTRGRLVDRGERRYRRFSWEGTTAALVAAYHQLAGRSASSSGTPAP
jgi:glycosyltransferase involved in cell wall biosynthesis